MSGALTDREKRIQTKFEELFGSSSPPPRDPDNTQPETKMTKMARTLSIRSKLKFENDTEVHPIVDLTENDDDDAIHRVENKHIHENTTIEYTVVSTAKDKPCPKSHKRNVVKIGTKRKTNNVGAISKNSDDSDPKTEITNSLDNNLQRENTFQENKTFLDNATKTKSFDDSCSNPNYIKIENDYEEEKKKVSEVNLMKKPIVSLVKLDASVFTTKNSIKVETCSENGKNNFFEIRNDQPTDLITDLQEDGPLKHDTKLSSRVCVKIENTITIKKEPNTDKYLEIDSNTGNGSIITVDSIKKEATSGPDVKQCAPLCSNSKTSPTVTETKKISVKPIQELTSHTDELLQCESTENDQQEAMDTSNIPVPHLHKFPADNFSDVSLHKKEDEENEKLLLRHIAEAFLYQMREFKQYKEKITDAEKFPGMVHEIKCSAHTQLCQSLDLVMRGLLKNCENIYKMFCCPLSLEKIKLTTKSLASERNISALFDESSYILVLSTTMKYVHDMCSRELTAQRTVIEQLTKIGSSFTMTNSSTQPPYPTTNNSSISDDLLKLASHPALPFKETLETRPIISSQQSIPFISSTAHPQSTNNNQQPLSIFDQQMACHNQQTYNIPLSQYSNQRIGGNQRQQPPPSIKQPVYNSQIAIKHNEKSSTLEKLLQDQTTNYYRQSNIPNAILNNAKKSTVPINNHPVPQSEKNYFRDTPEIPIVNFDQPSYINESNSIFPLQQCHFNNPTNMRTYQRQANNERSYQNQNIPLPVHRQYPFTNDPKNGRHPPPYPQYQPASVQVPKNWNNRRDDVHPQLRGQQVGAALPSPIVAVSHALQEEQRPISTDSGFMSPTSNTGAVSCRCTKGNCKKCRCATAGVDCNVDCRCGGHAINDRNNRLRERPGKERNWFV